MQKFPSAEIVPFPNKRIMRVTTTPAEHAALMLIESAISTLYANGLHSQAGMLEDNYMALLGRYWIRSVND